MDLLYKSTRNNNIKITSAQAIIDGIADDGGLYIPTIIPYIEKDLNELKHMSYQELAFYIMKKYLTDFDDNELITCIKEAYDSKFTSIAPIVEKDGFFFLELYHGQTLAFKDMALSILPYLMKCAYKKTKCEKEIVILTATSGDTGKAALEGFKDVDGVKIIVFYPKNGVSKIQERQMITQEGNNTFVASIDGNFDDAQSAVKKVFCDAEFNEILNKNNYILSSANSINIGRLIPQIVYYAYAYLQLLKDNKLNQGEKINVCVPTGNFGNILAAYYAKKMGFPIEMLICASNENNVLTEFINSGFYNKNRDFKLTNSPSMDIVVSSNLERLLYHISGNNDELIIDLMDDLKLNGQFLIDNNLMEQMKDFFGSYATSEQSLQTIKNLYESSGYLIDTHTAVALSVYMKYREKTKDSKKTVIVSTASPFKFVGSINDALGFSISEDDFMLVNELSTFAGLKIPKGIFCLESREVLHNSTCKASDIKEFIKSVLKVGE